MASGKFIDVSRLVDEQPFRLFHFQLVVLAMLAMIFDGYNLQAIGFAAPGLVKMWHVNRATLGPVFSASVIGMLFGAPLLGWVGDKIGRRRVIITGVLIYGGFTLVSYWAQTEQQLIFLRFLTGLGLGGVPANTIALIAEYTPKRIRGTLIMITQIGITIGSLLPAVISGTLEHDYGWRVQFLVGGLLPIAIGVLLVFLLPESLKFLVATQKSSAKVLKFARALDPSLTDSDYQFLLPRNTVPTGERFGMKQLFASGLQYITPVIWSIFIIILIGNFFLHSWMPILFRDEGLSIQQTATTAAMFDVGGIVGVLLVSHVLDKYGMVSLVAMFVLACPAVAAIGLIGQSVPLLSLVIFVAGFCMVSITLGINTVAGLIYPTEIRAKGVGWAYGIGRIGSIIGPMAGGWLIGMKLPITSLFLLLMIPMAIGIILSLVLLRLFYQRYNGLKLDDKPTPTFI
jgi:AAHS family 4-hydroxybenzoate transporter-like MFS transporter